MKLSTLRYFVTIADTQSIRKAAALLFNSQPNLSRAIHSLEAELGAELFERTPQGMILTPAGQDVYYYARSIVDQADTLSKLHTDASTPIQKNLHFAVTGILFPDALITQSISALTAQHITLDLKETNTEDLFDLIATGQSNTELFLLDHHIEHSIRRSLELKELACHPVADAAIAIHFSPEDPLFHETTIDPQLLSGYRLVRTPPDYFGYLSWGHLIEQYSFPRFNQTLTISQYHTIVRFLRTPGNILIGHTLQAQEFEKAGIQTRPIRGSQGQLTLSSVHHNHNQHTIPPEAKVLRAAVLNYYQQLP